VYIYKLTTDFYYNHKTIYFDIDFDIILL